MWMGVPSENWNQLLTKHKKRKHFQKDSLENKSAVRPWRLSLIHIYTTRHSQLFHINEGTYVFDTPGFTSLYIQDILPEMLKDYFPEFEPYEGRCRFGGCVHMNETDCMVKAALAEGKISKSRYDNYVLLYEELKNQKRY